MAREPKAAPSADDDDSKEPLIVVDFAKPVVPLTWLAIGAGAALVLFSIVGRRGLEIEPHFANLMVGSGIALILAAFGGQAVVRGKGYVFAGVAGIALGIVAFLSWEDHKFRDAANRKLELQKKSYLVGSITGLPVERYTVRLLVDDFVRSKHVPDKNRFDFVVFKEELDETTSASLNIEGKDDEAELINLKIPKRCLLGFLGQDVSLNWEYRESEAVLIEEETNAIIAAPFNSPAEVKACLLAPPSTAEGSGGGLLPSWISTAYAGEVLPPTRAEIDAAIEAIQSSDSDVRRGARVTLSRMPPEDVGYALAKIREKLAAKDNIYRSKLGIAVALTEMLRRDKSLRDRLKLEPADLNMLLEFAGSDDRTLRIYAGEFLYDLESPEITRLALPLALTATSDNARFNWILVSQGGWQRLDEQAKAELRPVLEKLQVATKSLPKTAALLAKFN